MTSGMEIWQQLHMSAYQHLPSGSVPALAGGAIGLGVLVCVLGARLARPALSLIFLGVGTVFADRFGDRLDLAYPLVLAIGAGLGGAVGFALFRLWVGVAAGVLFGCLTAGFMGHTELLSAIQQLEREAVAQLEGQDVGFSLLSPADQIGAESTSLPRVASRLWDRVQAKNPGLSRRLPIGVTLVGIVGLLLGLFAARLTVIVASAVAGTALLCAGAAALTQHFRPGVFDQLSGRGPVLLAGVIGFLLASSLLQAHLTRRPRVAPAV